MDTMTRLGLVPGLILALGCSVARGQSIAPGTAQPFRGGLDRETYRDRLEAMWLGQCLANWTGLTTEALKVSPPFFTDADWGTQKGDPAVNGGWIDFVIQDPWLADDDTDIEYIYLEAMVGAGRALLTADEIRDAWLAHIKPYTYIWVSNREAHDLMRASAPAWPGSTSLHPANELSRMIDAQLTTEIFGAMAPGMPVRALELADLPIRTTAASYAAHAAQFHVALYSLAAAADPALAPRDQVLWMVENARALLPDESKASDVIDFVLQGYLAAPDPDDWETARDAVFVRYQQQDTQNGFLYLQWYESPINLATGLIALLYGEGDWARTVQIGTLSGWDSDNGTATMGGLLGLLHGKQAIQDAFPGVAFSDYYDILRTRIGFSPPFCESWYPQCLDKLSAMTDRMLPLVEAEILGSGGVVEARTGAWKLPDLDTATLSVAQNPLWTLHRASGSNRLRELGDVPQITLTGATYYTGGPTGSSVAELVDGLEFDFSGIDRQIPLQSGRRWVALSSNGPGEPIEVTVRWSTPLVLGGVRVVEGPRDFYLQSTLQQAGFQDLTVEVRMYNTWVDVQTAPVTGPLAPGRSYEIVEWQLMQQFPADGIRLRGTPISTGLATISEIEGLVAE